MNKEEEEVKYSEEEVKQIYRDAYDAGYEKGFKDGEAEADMSNAISSNKVH